MRIVIRTLPLHNNYGGVLQNFALQKALQRLHHTVETLDRILPVVDILPVLAENLLSFVYPQKKTFC